MLHNLLNYFFFCLCFCLFACSNVNEATLIPGLQLKKDTGIRYAKRFAISSNQDITMVYLFGNQSNFDTTATYLIYKDASLLKNIPNNITLVKSPCTKIAALSSIYANMFCELGLINNLVAIDNIDYINNPELISKYTKQQLKELAKGPEIDIEQSIQLNPNIIFTFGMGDSKKDIHPTLLITKIPIAVSLDHKEETPLARAEWIKFFAAFVNKKEKADSIFNTIEKKYLQLKALANETKNKPTVFNDIKYSDSWYMPGGKSYLAQLLKDAGANYLWQNNLNFGSITLSFEQVYAKAKEADFWINLSTLKTKKDVINFDTRYSEFKAFKNGQMYNNTKFTNKKGYSTYWETGIIYPEKILNDLLLIFHPELKSKLNPNFYYYEQLK